MLTREGNSEPASPCQGEPDPWPRAQLQVSGEIRLDFFFFFFVGITSSPCEDTDSACLLAIYLAFPKTKFPIIS